RGNTRWPRDWSSDVCSSDLQILHFTVDPDSMFIAARAEIEPPKPPDEDRIRIDREVKDLADRVRAELAKRGIAVPSGDDNVAIRSEERRVGKECRDR